MKVGETIPDKIRSYFKNESEGRKWGHAAIVACATVVFPILIGILSSATSTDNGTLFSIPPDGVSIAFAIVILLQVAFVLILRLYWKNAPTYYDFTELENDYESKVENISDRFERTRKNLNSMLQMQEASRYASMALGNVESLAAEDGDGTNDLQQGIALVLDSCVSFRAEIFGFQAKTLYNFAVYLYNETDDVLRLAWRECDSRINRQDRDWHPRDGHVGTCFANRRELFSNNVLESDELSHDDPEDEQKYVSMVSIPIFPSGDFPDDRVAATSRNQNTKPIGVFIVTSSKEEQFNRSLHKTFLLSLSYHLSFVIERIRERKGS